LKKCLFAPGGSDAVEMAMKLSMGYTNRFKMLSFWDSFHGAGFGAISVGGEAIFRGQVSLLSGMSHVAPPDCYRCPYGQKGPDCCNLECAAMVRYILEKEGDVAAFIAEAIRSVPFIPPYAYWTEVRKACDDCGTMLIIDQIPQGLGKTGRWFSSDHYDLVPDIIVLGKALGGGILPLAAIIAREKMDVLGDRAIGHYTHEKNPVLAAAGLATIQVIEEEHLVDNSRIQGQYALKRMEEMKELHPLIGDVRGKGLVLGVELVKDRKTKERATDQAEQVLYKCLAKGLSFKITMGNVITLYPPMITTRSQMDEALNILEESINEVEE
jgi:4-aminobutyrate aminotransferase